MESQNIGFDMNIIQRPTLILDINRMTKNIRTMKTKANSSDVIFRPHFKTHQSAEIGKLFKLEGIDAITVSSVEMAFYFADSGFKDILIAFPVNILELEKINEIASEVDLHLLVDSEVTLDIINRDINETISVYIKIDTGYRRSGLVWNENKRILGLAQRIASSHHSFKGILTHSGHSYQTSSHAEITSVYKDSTQKMNSVADHLRTNGVKDFIISTGDTPCCSVVQKFYDIDEIRPGNFVFYDVMQANLSVCNYEDIAVAIACPVVGKYEDRKQVVLYGGAIHFSKEAIETIEGKKIFGYRTSYNESGFTKTHLDNPLISVSQEHGIMQLDKTSFEKINIGDIVMVLPAHSCLAATQFHEYQLLNSEIIEKM